MGQPLLGSMEADPVSEILGTGFMRFLSPVGVQGLAKESVGHLEILAVMSMRPGTGQFRRFIETAKRDYHTISVYEDWNPIVGEALARYGFIRITERQPDGDVLEGWRWQP